jgi:hypothetical protein
MTHTVKLGETLSKIASDNGLTIDQLLNANPQFKANPNDIKVGDELVIPDGGTQPAAGPPPEAPSPDESLGKLSEKFETGGRGPGTVSSGQGDKGGVSYGSYQMSSKLGVAGSFVSQPDFPFRDRFAGLMPGTPGFTAVWREIAASAPDQFQATQHGFIKRTHYDPLVGRIMTEDGLDITKRSHTLRDVIWSTAVQHGPKTPIPHKARATLKLKPDDPGFDKEFIVAIYGERGRKDASGKLVHFSRNSQSVQNGVAKRFAQEQKDALNMLKDELGS